jgi:TonB family protein
LSRIAGGLILLAHRITEKEIMLEQTQPRSAAAEQAAQYRRRMLLALGLLLTALVVMLVKDRSFWFGAEETSAGYEPGSISEQAAVSAPEQPTEASAPTAISVTPVKKHQAAKHEAQPVAEGASVVASERAVLPPLEVMVVNGNSHRSLQPATTAVKLDMQSDAAARELAPVTNAVQRTDIVATKTQPSQSSYPSLAGQMKVQGSVLLQAFIGADGVIQDVHVISGPSILSSAAREAALQWRFKPYLQNGKPVETQARITVNFVIKVWDDEARDHDAVGKTAHTQAAHPGE